MSRRKRRGWLITSLVLGLITVAVAAALYAPRVVERTLEGDDAHDLVTRHTARNLHMAVGFLPLESKGLEVISAGLLGRTDDPAQVEELRAHGIAAQSSLSEIKRKRLRVKELTIRHLEAGFGKEAVANLTHPFDAPPPLTPPGPDDGSPWDAEIEKMGIGRTDILWGNEKANFGGFRGTMVETERVGEGKFRIRGRDGTLLQTGWPELTIQSFVGNYSQEVVTIEETQLLLAGRDPVAITGEVRIGSKSGMRLNVKGTDCDVTPFLPEKMRAKLSGKFTTETVITKSESQGGEAATAVEGRVRFNHAIVRRIEALNRVAKFTGIDDFSRLELDALEGAFQWRDDLLEVKDFRLEAEGLLRLEGVFTLKGENLRGNFKLGVSRRVLASFPGADEAVFTQSRKGYRWTPVRISGSLEEPEEDLKPRLVAAAKAHYAKKFLAPILKPGKAIIEAIERLF